MTPARAAQVEDAVAIVRGLLGERDATRVHVEVTRGGTFRVEAEVTFGEPAKAVHEWKPRQVKGGK